MPKIIDFSTVGGKKVIQTFPRGWVTPLLVEYGIKQINSYDPGLSIVWRIYGTIISWTILEQRMNVLSKANYQSHFENALENLRALILVWIESDDYKNLEWVNKYVQEYKEYIIDNDGKTLLSKRFEGDSFEEGLNNFQFDINKLR